MSSNSGRSTVHQVLGNELCPPNSNVEALTPRTSECDSIWRRGIKLKGGLAGGSSSNVTHVLIRGED